MWNLKRYLQTYGPYILCILEQLNELSSNYTPLIQSSGIILIFQRFSNVQPHLLRINRTSAKFLPNLQFPIEKLIWKEYWMCLMSKKYAGYSLMGRNCRLAIKSLQFLYLLYSFFIYLTILCGQWEVSIDFLDRY